MTTASDLVGRSLRLIGVLGTGRRTPTSNELADGIVSLNSMLESFSLERLMVYQILEESFVLTVGTANYAIGDGVPFYGYGSATLYDADASPVYGADEVGAGLFNTVRPIKIENAFLRDSSSNDYPLLLIDNIAYDSLPLKTVTSRPQYLYYDTMATYAYVRLMYVPAYADTIYINSWKHLQQFTDGTTELVLPPGYERMIVYNLAVELSGEYQGSPIPPSVEMIAKQSKANLKRINAKIPIAVSNYPGESGGIGKRNIFTG